MQVSQPDINSDFLIKGVVRQIRYVAKMCFFDLTEGEESISVWLDSGKIKKDFRPENAFEVILKGEFKLSKRDKVYFEVSDWVSVVMFGLLETNQEEAFVTDYCQANSLDNSISVLKSVHQAKAFLNNIVNPALLPSYKTTPVLQKIIKLGENGVKLKTDVKQFLQFFEYFVNKIVGQKRKAEVSVVSKQDDIKFEVFSIDFEADEVDSMYQQYISFYMDPSLLEEIQTNFKQKIADYIKTNLSRKNKAYPSSPYDKQYQDILKLRSQIMFLTQAMENLDIENNFLKRDLLHALDTKAVLQIDKSFLQESLQLSLQNSPHKTMNQVNINNSTISNSEIMNYSNIHEESIQIINDLVQSTQDDEDLLLGIQSNLLRIIELVKTNQEILTETKVEVFMKVQEIAKQVKSDKSNTKNHIIENAVHGLLKISKTIKEASDLSESVINLSGLLGIKL